mmetsp:Transcript_93356/g.302162  ORF Transcript_93356/g.302162 Transcript_93356/m.302162 type:complete len:223 (+) Transcript_93356:161-829(+)
MLDVANCAGEGRHSRGDQTLNGTGFCFSVPPVRHCTNIALAWFQSSGQCRCNSMLHFSRSCISSSAAASAAGRGGGERTPKASSLPSVPFTTRLTKISQTTLCAANVDGAAPVATAGCAPTRSFRTWLNFAWKASNSGSWILSASCSLLPLLGNLCGKMLLSNSVCWFGLARKRNQMIRGNTKKSCTSQSSHICASAGASCCALRISATRSHTAPRSASCCT